MRCARAIPLFAVKDARAAEVSAEELAEKYKDRGGSKIKMMKTDQDGAMDRRGFLTRATLAAGSAAVTAVLGGHADAQSKNEVSKGADVKTDLGTRKLGNLTVSSIGMGVQNMHRRYE